MNALLLGIASIFKTLIPKKVQVFRKKILTKSEK